MPYHLPDGWQLALVFGAPLIALLVWLAAGAPGRRGRR